MTLTESFTQNFALSIIGAQIPDTVDSERVLNDFDMFLVCAFTAELCINMLANWFRDFVSSLWNWFDVAIVSLSLIGLSPAGLSLRIVLLLRCFRVLRIFGKLKAVAKIFSALSYAILPMYCLARAIANTDTPARTRNQAGVRA
jgi:hypothetical protein